ncbi:MAG: hypothetical protein ACF8TS_19025 [Maioricimonas sp. JB049]
MPFNLAESDDGEDIVTPAESTTTRSNVPYEVPFDRAAIIDIDGIHSRAAENTNDRSQIDGPRPNEVTEIQRALGVGAEVEADGDAGIDDGGLSRRRRKHRARESEDVQRRAGIGDKDIVAGPVVVDRQPDIRPASLHDDGLSQTRNDRLSGERNGTVEEYALLQLFDIQTLPRELCRVHGQLLG